MAITLNHLNNIRIVTILISVVLCSYVASLPAWTEIFTDPEALEGPWHVTSALRKQGQDRLEPATHLHLGGIRLLSYQTVTPDQAQLEISTNTFSLSVTPKSTLRISVGSESPFNVDIIDGFLTFEDKRSIPIDMTQRRDFVIQKGGMHLRQEDELIWLGPVQGTMIQLSAPKKAAIVNYFSYVSNGKTIIFEKKENPIREDFIFLGIALGILLGYFFHPAHIIGILCILIGIKTPIYTWFELQENLALTSITPWKFQQNIICLSFLPLCISSISQFSLSIKKRRLSGYIYIYIWYVISLMFCLTHIQVPVDILWILYILLPISLVWRMPFRNQYWYALDIIGILLLWLPTIGLLLSLLWRWVVLLKNLSLLKTWNKRPLLDIVFVYFLCMPIAIEFLLPTPQMIIDNTPSEWKQASATFQAKCGSEEEQFRILYAGGSSMGGAYQLQGDAFFAEYIHQKLCAQGYAIHTKNIGGAARNSYTVVESMNVWKLFQPDLIIFYGGVNDLLDKRYRKSRREREDSLQLSRSMGLLSIAQQSDIIQILGRLLSKNNTKTVSEVSIVEAEDNLLQIASLENSKTLLLTEWIREPQKKRLQPYAQMEQKLADQNDHIFYIDLRQNLSDREIDRLLLDANHPSSEGHKKLSEIITTWITVQLNK